MSSSAPSTTTIASVPDNTTDLGNKHCPIPDKCDAGHDLDDQRHAGKATLFDPLTILLSSVDRFDGKGDGEEWLKRIIARLDSLHLSVTAKNDLVPDLLTDDALFWYAQYQQEMPTFILFVQRFLQKYTSHRPQPSESIVHRDSSSPLKQTTNTDSTTAVVMSLRHQMLLNSLDKLSKFSGRGTHNVSQWLREIEQSMHLLKLTEEEKFFFISSCLESDARDWYFDNIHAIPTWRFFVQKFIQTFESSGTADIAFNRLRHYQQGLNQDVRHYYFEIMKLCKQANPSMDMSTKLQYLKDGLKPSLRFDVLMKDPATPEEFLEVAQRIAELKSLDHKHTELPASSPLSDSFNDFQPLMRSGNINNSRLANSTMISAASSHRQTPPSTYQCYRCGSPHHYIRDCPQSKATYNHKAPSPPSQCYHCGGTDHFFRNCPHFQ